MTAPPVSEIPTIVFLRRHGMDKVAHHIERAIETRPEIGWILAYPKTSAAIGFVFGCAVALVVHSSSPAEKVAIEVGSGIGGALSIRYAVPAVATMLSYLDDTMDRIFPSRIQQPPL